MRRISNLINYWMSIPTEAEPMTKMSVCLTIQTELACSVSVSGSMRCLSRNKLNLGNEME
jgi:hypothetical protein